MHLELFELIFHYFVCYGEIDSYFFIVAAFGWALVAFFVQVASAIFAKLLTELYRFGNKDVNEYILMALVLFVWASFMALFILGIVEAVVKVE